MGALYYLFSLLLLLSHRPTLQDVRGKEKGDVAVGSEEGVKGLRVCSKEDRYNGNGRVEEGKIKKKRRKGKQRR